MREKEYLCLLLHDLVSDVASVVEEGVLVGGQGGVEVVDSLVHLLFLRQRVVVPLRQRVGLES